MSADQRGFGATFGAAAAAFVAATAIACRETTEPAHHPHVLVLLADDLGWADVGYHATTDGSAISPRTPAIDRLARDGLVLERYYTAAACTPSRAGLLTGRSPVRLGLLRNLTAREDAGLAVDEELWPELFRRAGYATALVGKWHLGHARPEQRPDARGFDHWYGFLTGWVDYSTHEREAGSSNAPDWWRDGRPVREEGYATELFAREATRAIRERDRSRPLFLYVAFNAPHTPLHEPPGAAPPGATPIRSSSDPSRAAYVHMVEALDRAVGSIRDALESEGIARDTIVVFASDNGGHVGYGARNEPLREGKFSVYEGGIRAPAVIAWPGVLAPRSVDALVTHLDLMPTIARAAGVALAPERALDGRDLWEVLAHGAPGAPSTFCAAIERARELRYAWIDEPWKLVEVTLRPENTVVRALYRLDRDPEEREDLARAEPATVARLAAELEPWKRLPRLPFAGGAGGDKARSDADADER